jgi:hypothetical protein
VYVVSLHQHVLRDTDINGTAFNESSVIQSRSRWPCWDRGFESHLRHGCQCAFILCLCYPMCAGSGLVMG